MRAVMTARVACGCDYAGFHRHDGGAGHSSDYEILKVVIDSVISDDTTDKPDFFIFCHRLILYLFTDAVGDVNLCQPALDQGSVEAADFSVAVDVAAGVTVKVCNNVLLEPCLPVNDLDGVDDVDSSAAVNVA